MITLTKDGAVKFLDAGSSLLPKLKAAGWKAEGEPEPEDAPKKRGPKPKVQE